MSESAAARKNKNVDARGRPTKSCRLPAYMIDHISVILTANRDIPGFPATIADFIEDRLANPTAGLPNEFNASLRKMGGSPS